MAEYIIETAKGKWEVVVALEIHCQIISKSKIFSGASTEFGGREYRSCSAVRSMSAILLIRLPSEAITNELILPELPVTGSAGIRRMWTAISKTNCADLPLP